MHLHERVSSEPQFRSELTVDGGVINMRIQDTYDITTRAFCNNCGNTIEDVDIWVKRMYNDFN